MSQELMKGESLREKVSEGYYKFMTTDARAGVALLAPTLEEQRAIRPAEPKGV